MERSGTEFPIAAVLSSGSGSAHGCKISVYNWWPSARIEAVNSPCIVISENISVYYGFDLITGHSVGGNLIEFLFFQRSKKTLHSGIIKTFPCTAKALNHTI